MPSTVIRRFLYDINSSELCVEFVSGRRYVYAAVPPGIAETFRQAFSKGSYFNARIRDRFRVREVTDVNSATES
jgi:hypothetical protein